MLVILPLLQFTINYNNFASRKDKIGNNNFVHYINLFQYTFF